MMIGRLTKISYSRDQKHGSPGPCCELTTLYGNLNCKAGGKGNRRLLNHSADSFFGFIGGGGASGRW